MAKVYREDAEQKALIQWADLTRLPAFVADSGDKIGAYLFAIPNGGARSRIEAARLIGLGVRPGVSDLFFSYPVGAHAGLYIEMKAPAPYSSQVSKAQKQFMARMTSAGYQAQVCKGWEPARDCILAYLTP